MPSSQAVKASDFDSDIRWFESNLGSQPGKIAQENWALQSV